MTNWIAGIHTVCALSQEVPWLLESVVRIRPLKSPFQNRPRKNHVIDEEEMTGNMEQAGCASSFANALLARHMTLIGKIIDFPVIKIDYDHAKLSCKGLI
jgi:hypothetical protein